MLPNVEWSTVMTAFGPTFFAGMATVIGGLFLTALIDKIIPMKDNPH